MKNIPDITKEDLKGKFRIASNGTWYHNGTAFPENRLNMVKLFARYLTRKKDGSYAIQVIVKGRLVDEAEVIVEDAPFVITQMQCSGKGKSQTIKMKTNLDEFVIVGKETPIRIDFSNPDNPRPYVDLANGLSAKIERSVYFELANMATEEKTMPAGHKKLGIWSQKIFFPLEP